MGKGTESRSFSLISHRIRFHGPPHHLQLLANKSGFIFPDTDFFFFFLNTLLSDPTEAARYPTPWAGAPPSSTLFCLGISRDPCPCEHPHPSRQKGGKPGERGGAEKKKGESSLGGCRGGTAGGSPGRRVERAAPARRRKPCTCSNPGVSTSRQIRP